MCVVLAVPASAKLLFIFEKCNNCASGKLLFISDKCNNCASVKLLLALPRVGTSPCWHFPAPRVGKSPCFHGTQHQKPTSPRKTPQTDKTLMIYRNPHETTRHRLFYRLLYLNWGPFLGPFLGPLIFRLDHFSSSNTTIWSESDRF